MAFQYAAELNDFEATAITKNVHAKNTITTIQNRLISVKPDAEEMKINEIKKSIHTFSEKDIIKNTLIIKSKIYESDLIDRLNRNLLTDSEREEANDMLTRLALLGFEKAQRGLDNMEPELKSAIEKHKENLDRIKQLLDDGN